MPSRPSKRRVLKWAGMALSVLLLATYIFRCGVVGRDAVVNIGAGSISYCSGFNNQLWQQEETAPRSSSGWYFSFRPSFLMPEGSPSSWIVWIGSARYWKRWVDIPLHLPLLFTLGVTLWLWRLGRRRFSPGHCAQCGYNLTGNLTGRCPECGALAFDSQEVK